MSLSIRGRGVLLLPSLFIVAAFGVLNGCAKVPVMPEFPIYINGRYEAPGVKGILFELDTTYVAWIVDRSSYTTAPSRRHMTPLPRGVLSEAVIPLPTAR